MRAEPAQTQDTPPIWSNLESACREFSPISLCGTNSVSLMRRIDTKFIIHQDQLPGVLSAVNDHYAILEINGQRAMQYVSQYFDTPACKFYTDHHNGKAGRAKVRIRSYLNTGVSFLEVKRKSVKGITSKHRIPWVPGETHLTSAALEFIGETLPDIQELHPTVGNQFWRLTLVDTDRGERVTIDWSLSSQLHGVGYPHPYLIIIEVKQEGLDRHAPIMCALKSLGARPYRVSKYCLGMTCLYPDLKTNRFKSRLLRIGKITSDFGH